MRKKVLKTPKLKPLNKKYWGFTIQENNSSIDFRDYAIEFNNKTQAENILNILKTYGFELKEYASDKYMKCFNFIAGLKDSQYPSYFKEEDKNKFVLCQRGSNMHINKKEISYDEFLALHSSKKIIINKNFELDPFEEEDWGYTIQESNADVNMYLYYKLFNKNIRYSNLKECQDICKTLKSIGFKVYNYDKIMNISEEEYKKNKYVAFTHTKNGDIMTRTKSKEDGYSYQEFMDIFSGTKKIKLTKNFELDPFEEEDWGYTIQEKINSSEKEGTIDLMDFSSTWENVSETEYRNIKSGKLKDIKKLFEGPIALIINGEIKMFNGGSEEIDINFINDRNTFYFEISPFKKIKKKIREQINRTFNSNYRSNLRFELMDYQNKTFRLPLNSRLVFLDCEKLLDFIFNLSKTPNMVIIGKNMLGNDISFEMNNFFKMFYVIENPSLVIINQNAQESRFDLSEPISYKIVEIRKNLEVDPYGEEDWDDLFN